MTVVRRRQFLQKSLAVAGLGLLVGCGNPLTPVAPPARRYRIGFLAPSTEAAATANLEAFRQGLREHGYLEEQNVALVIRYTEGRADRLPDLLRELLGANVDVTVTGGGSDAIRAAQQATSTTPMVFATASDLVSEGLVASLARPGGNATGLTISAGQEGAKRLQLLKEVLPHLSRVAVLWNPPLENLFRETEVAAQTMDVQLLSLQLGGPADVDTALADAITGRAEALIGVASALVFSLAPRIVDFAAKHRLPAMYAQINVPRQGGLMAYGPNVQDNYRRAATFVDRILKGAKPGDLPIELPTKFDFVINLKTAEAIGLTIPSSILQQATELIQ